MTHSLSLIQQASSFWLILQRHSKPSRTAKSLQSSAEMNEVKYKTLTLTYEGQQLETKDVCNKA